MIISAKVAEQQKTQRAENVKVTNLKQTQDRKLAESFTPITKKLEDVDNSTEKLGEVIEKTSRIDTKNVKLTLQRSQSQTLKLVSAIDELVETFSKMNDSKIFLK